MKTSENINELSKAMCAAQALMTVAEINSVNPHFKSKYSNLDSVIDAFRKPLTSNGLTYWQDVTVQEGNVCVTTRISHSSGQWVEFGPLCIPFAKKDAHGIGSATTYGKRYALCAAMGIAPGENDDDANAAVGEQKQKKEEKKEPPKVEGQPLTREQTKELHELAELCDPEYMAKLYSYLESLGVKGFENLKSDKYERVIKGMRTNAEMTQKAKG